MPAIAAELNSPGGHRIGLGKRRDAIADRGRPAVTIMVNRTCDQSGCLHARLLDALVGRSGTVYRAWLDGQPDRFIDGIEQAALDPFRVRGHQDDPRYKIRGLHRHGVEHLSEKQQARPS